VRDMGFVSRTGGRRLRAACRRSAGARGWLSRTALLLAMLLPVWAVWAYAYATLRGLRGEVGALPRFYGIHLHKEQTRKQLECFARFAGSMEDVGRLASPGLPNAREIRERLGEAARLFGLDGPLLVLGRDRLQVLYTASPEGTLASILGDAGTREALFLVVSKMAAEGLREGFCYLGASGPAAAASARWYLLAAYAGRSILCVLMVPEKNVNGAGDHLLLAQDTLLRESLTRFVMVTLPIVFVSSMWLGMLCWGGRSRRSDRPEERADESGGEGAGPPRGY
jgi:hypothetical protein